MAEPEVDLLDDLAARVRTGPVMVGNILEPDIAELAAAIIERGTVARPLPRQRPPIACGHPTTAVAYDEAGVEICVACTGEASGLTVRVGERLRIGRVAIEVCVGTRSASSGATTSRGSRQQSKHPNSPRCRWR